MKLSDLRPCAGCGGPLFQGTTRCFQIVQTSLAIITQAGLEVARAAARQGVPLERLEASPSNAAVIILADQAAAMGEKLQLCIDCYHRRPIADIVRRRQERREIEVSHGGGRAS